MYLLVQGLLKPGELDIIHQIITNAQFEDGTATATNAAQMVKKNLQLPKNGSFEKQQIDAIILSAIGQSPLIQAALLPCRVLPPIIGKYEPGMHYGMHVDSPIMSDPQMGVIRTDVGMTLFLCNPDEYEGGELAIQSQTGLLHYKLQKGDAIIYPTTQIHGVLPVTEGVRLVAVTWMQCTIRDPQQRETLFQLKQVQASIEQKGDLPNENLILLQAMSNLTRMWAEL